MITAGVRATISGVIRASDHNTRDLPVNFDQVILSNPTLLDSQAFVGDVVPRSWIQLARTGAFVSNRYGKFSITKDDLATMLRNFKTVTPKEPTELPIDWDHLSMDPKKPGDGAAAGWMKRLELRDGGETLWAEVEWTPQGAEAVRTGSYRFVSPSFVKDHTHKDGTKIGTTLLAAAITNHPFLEGMKALTLYSLNALGELADLQGNINLAVDVKDEDKVFNLPFAEYADFADCVEKNGDKDDPKAFCGWLKNKIEGSADPDVRALSEEWAALRAISLSEIGQRVMISPGHARTQDEVGGTFEITEVVGDGENAFVTIKDANGVPHKWFRATELLPASATPANPIQPNLVPAPGVPGQPAAGTPGQPGQPGQPAGVPGAPVPPGAPGAPKMAAAAAGVPGAVPPNPNGPPADPVEALIQQKMAEVMAKGKKPGALPPKPGAASAPPGAAKPRAPGNPATNGATAGATAVKDKAKDGGADVPAFLKKKKQKGIANMMFKLRNDKTNEEIEVSDEQLAAAGIKVVPEGSTAVPVSDLAEMKSTITNLSEKVETLSKETVAVRARSVLMELHTELSRLSKGGFITKATRDALEAQFGSAHDLTAFKALAATFTKPVVVLETEHGSGADVPADKTNDATQKLISLSQKIAKEQGISLRDATLEAGKQLEAEVEQYQGRFRPQEVGA